MIPSRRFLEVALIITTAFSTVARCDDATSDQVLKRLGVIRRGSICVLAEEATVKKKLNEARIAYRRLSDAINHQRELEQFAKFNRADVRQLAAQRLQINEQLAAAGGGLPVQQHNQFVATINALSDRIRELDAEMPDAATRRQADEQVAQRREAFIQAILDLRKLVDQTGQKYLELAKDDVLQKAMAASEPKSKSPPKLGPSADFKTCVKQLESVEKLVLTDTVAVVSKGEVYEVQVTLNDRLTMPFIYDTGASLVTVSSEVATRLGLEVADSDPTIRIEIADGTIIEAKRKTIPSVRVGRFTVKDVECAVMPSNKSKMQQLLGQSFLRHFTISGSPASGKLVMSRVGGEDAPSNRGDRSKAPSKKVRRSIR